MGRVQRRHVSGARPIGGACTLQCVPGAGIVTALVSPRRRWPNLSTIAALLVPNDAETLAREMLLAATLYYVVRTA